MFDGSTIYEFLEIPFGSELISEPANTAFESELLSCHEYRRKRARLPRDWPGFFNLRMPQGEPSESKAMGLCLEADFKPPAMERPAGY
jgi:hypothetical protein